MNCGYNKTDHALIAAAGRSPGSFARGHLARKPEESVLTIQLLVAAFKIRLMETGRREECQKRPPVARWPSYLHCMSLLQSLFNKRIDSYWIEKVALVSTVSQE